MFIIFALTRRFGFLEFFPRQSTKSLAIITMDVPCQMTHLQASKSTASWSLNLVSLKIQVMEIWEGFLCTNNHVIEVTLLLFIALRSLTWYWFPVWFSLKSLILTPHPSPNHTLSWILVSSKKKMIRSDEFHQNFTKKKRTPHPSVPIPPSWTPLKVTWTIKIQGTNPVPRTSPPPKAIGVLPFTPIGSLGTWVVKCGNDGLFKSRYNNGCFSCPKKGDWVKIG